MAARPPNFRVLSNDGLRLVADAKLHAMYLLSPFVWKTAEGFQILVRAVNRDKDRTKKIARIFHGGSLDGVAFEMRRDPVVEPGPEPDDLHGCEDPSAICDGNRLFVFYTGWNERHKIGKLLWACGPEAASLEKRGVALESTAT